MFEGRWWTLILECPVPFSEVSDIINDSGALTVKELAGSVVVAGDLMDCHGDSAWALESAIFWSCLSPIFSRSTIERAIMTTRASQRERATGVSRPWSLHKSPCILPYYRHDYVLLLRDRK